MYYLSSRTVLVFPEPLHTFEAHLGVQERPGVHAKKSAPVNSQPRGQVVAENPQVALQSECF